MPQLALAGAAGRMGQAVLRCCTDDSSWYCLLPLVRSQHLWCQQPVNHYFPHAQGGQFVADGDDLDWSSVEVLIDFSHVSCTEQWLARARQYQIPLVICTTGHTPIQQQAIINASQALPILQAANTSLGVTITTWLVEQAATLLAGAEADIIEYHHRHKKDAPSGTALQLAQAVAKGLGQPFQGYDPLQDQGQRPEHVVGLAAVRSGQTIGEHQVVLSTDHEQIQISHKATDRRLFASGALAAAQWLMSKPAGLYQMKDLIAKE